MHCKPGYKQFLFFAVGLCALTARAVIWGDVAPTSTVESVVGSLDGGTQSPDQLLLAELYPNGDVRSKTELASSLKYSFYSNDYQRIATVYTFADTHNAQYDNHGMIGRVVIPPYVDRDGNPYLTDDGTRYRVQAIGGSGHEAGEFWANTNTTAVVASTALLSLREDAFTMCFSLRNLSLPSVMLIEGRMTFMSFGSLECIDFGPIDRTPVLFVEDPAVALKDVPLTCRMVVPDARYGEWVDSLSPLVRAGYVFVRSSEWHTYARRYEAKLTPVYGGDEFTPWAAHSDSSVPLTLVWGYDWTGYGPGWVINGTLSFCRPKGGRDDLEVTFTGDDQSVVAGSVAFTRTRAAASGYTVGGHTDMPVQPMMPGLDTRPVPIPASAAARGVTFEYTHSSPAQSDHEDQNVAIELGHGAKAAVTVEALENAPDNASVRSTSVAIGAYADATLHGDGSSLKNQAIAIGWHSQARGSNAIAIGSGAQHTNETAMTGGAAYALGSETVALGYMAKAVTNNAVQIGRGVNDTPNSLKFWNTMVVQNGKLAVDEEGIENRAVARATNAAKSAIQGEGYTRILYEERDGYKQVSIIGDGEEAGRDARLAVRCMTNSSAQVSLEIGDAHLYTVPRIDSMTNGLWQAVRGVSGTLGGQVYDFESNVGLYKAVRDLVVAFGGSVTNFPAIPGE